MPSGSSCTADVTDTFSYDWIQFRTVGPGVFVNYRELSNTSTLQVNSHFWIQVFQSIISSSVTHQSERRLCPFFPLDLGI